MFLKSKRSLFAFLFASLIVHSACTKDEEAMKSPVKNDSPKSDEAAPPPQDQAAAESNKQFTPVYFDFDSSVVKDTYHDQVVSMSEFLKSNADTVQVAGHADERGTTEYNLALGSRRADAVKSMMVQMGVSEGKVTTISFGKEQPVDEGHNEEAWRKNRRAEFHLMK